MMYKLLRNYRHARREYEHITGLAEQTAKGIQDFLGGDETLLERLKESEIASRQRFYEIEDATIAEFKSLVAKGKDTLVIENVLSGGLVPVCVIRVYADAIIIIEDNRRTVLYVADDEIQFYAPDPQLEIYLEGGGLIDDYDFCPF